MLRAFITWIIGISAVAAFIILVSSEMIMGKHYHVDLVDPEMAPESIRAQVMRGYQIIQFTNKLLPDYVDDKLTCNNCHIGAGNTLGGKLGGISLVGSIRTYPKYIPRFQKVIDIVDRINNCLERSMNGKPLARDSEAMQALLAYLDWIASPLPMEKNYPWLGLEKLASLHVPNAKNGALAYEKYCALCHRSDGEGTIHNPPVWGPHAYNEGAGMSMPSKLASFIYFNMPYDDPFLTEEQAIDIAAYMIEQRRPQSRL